MLFSTNITLAVFAILASAATVSGVPHNCPYGPPTVTVTVTDRETATVSVGHPVSTWGHPAPTHSVSHPVISHPLPTPSHASPPPVTGSGGSGGKMSLCCNAKGNADSVAITALANILGLDLSGKTGLVGVLCNVIGEGYIGECPSASLITCSNLVGILGSDCSV